jgi:uncharacterized protein YdeI (YjbR/CyaY-like superfamily)
MKDPNPEFDAYFERAPDFARPIMAKIRKAAHRACPDIREVMKWSRPHFEFEGLVAGMGANNRDVSFGFWKGELLHDGGGAFEKVGNTAITAIKIEKLTDLPTQKLLVDLFKRAVDLNRSGTKPARKKKAAKRPPPKAPADLMAALKKNKKALKTYEGFSPSHKREYVEWITEAKRQATREKRLAQAVEWMAQGKPRNWKYMNC